MEILHKLFTPKPTAAEQNNYRRSKQIHFEDLLKQSMFENMTQFWEWYIFTVVYGWVVYLRAYNIGKKYGTRFQNK